MHSLFTPAQLGPLSLSNRLVRSATMDPYGLADGTVAPRQVELYEALAATGVGLIITGHTAVSPLGRASATQNLFCDDIYLAGQRQVTQAVHRQGGQIVLQLSHAGANSLLPAPEGTARLSPSGIPVNPKGLSFKAMTEEEMAQTTQAFVQAALRAKEAGFDGIQLHCAHSYLLSEFLDPDYNTRTDAYGGSAEGRFRFPGQVLAAVRQAVGPQFPVLVKINANCAQHDDTYAEDLLYYCREMERLGATAIELSGCDFTPRGRAGERLYYLDRAKRVKAAVGIPVLLVGGARTRAEMEQVLEEGVDFVSLCRPFICQPDFALRLREGQNESPCVNCARCFTLFEKEGRRCVLHPKP
jgi:2,4-dienoyl-CoA reductase-like NADH-dependent reductase (Old Yellow Enzyme family)